MMATEARIMPGWRHVAAVGQLFRQQRGRVAGFGAILWRRKLPVLACLGGVLGLTAGYVGTLAPAYHAEALVDLRDRPDARVGQGAPVQDEALQAGLRLIESRAMAERLVDRLGLQFLPEFHSDAVPGARAADRFGEWLPDALLDRLPKAWAATLAPRPSDGDLTDEQRAANLREQVVDAARARIRAEATPPSVIGVTFISEYRQLAAAGANALAELYLEERAALRQNALRSDREALEGEIERLRARVRQTEQAIEAARAGADAQAGPSGEQTRLDLTGELAFWRRERAELEGRLRQMQATLESGGNLDGTVLLLDSEPLHRLEARARELQQGLVALAQQFGEHDPQVIDLRTELAALEQERRAEFEQVLQRLQDELAIIQSRETTLEARIKALEEQSAETQPVVDLAILEQRLEADRAALRAYLEQAAGQLGTGPPAPPQPDARVIAPAVAPDQPTYPRLALIWSIASAGALLLGVSLAVALEALDRRRA